MILLDIAVMPQVAETATQHPDILQSLIELTIILFISSMVSEKFADLMKCVLSKKLGFNDLRTKYESDDERENKRKDQILFINIGCGVVIAAILNIDLILILKNLDDTNKQIGWPFKTFEQGYNILLKPFGFILSGFFLGLGSKFWHDLLDMLYQAKNAKRILNDMETYKTDKVEQIEKLYSTYESDFIQLAYSEAKDKYLDIDTVKGIGIKKDLEGYYFEIIISEPTPEIPRCYHYTLTNGVSQTVRIKLVELEKNDIIMACSANLSSKVFNIKKTNNWGTLGVLVKPVNSSTEHTFLLTCCHNLYNPVLGAEKNITAATFDNNVLTEIGSLVKTRENIDVALIKIETDSLIKNEVPKMGKPKKAKEIKKEDINTLDVCFYGAKTQDISEGKVKSEIQNIKIRYEEEELILPVIEISATNQEGDSGACVLDKNHNVLGIVVARRNNATYILPINLILNKLNVQLI